MKTTAVCDETEKQIIQPIQPIECVLFATLLLSLLLKCDSTISASTLIRRSQVLTPLW